MITPLPLFTIGEVAWTRRGQRPPPPAPLGTNQVQSKESRFLAFALPSGDPALRTALALLDGAVSRDNENSRRIGKTNFFEASDETNLDDMDPDDTDLDDMGMTVWLCRRPLVGQMGKGASSSTTGVNLGMIALGISLTGLGFPTYTRLHEPKRFHPHALEARRRLGSVLNSFVSPFQRCCFPHVPEDLAAQNFLGMRSGSLSIGEIPEIIWKHVEVEGHCPDDRGDHSEVNHHERAENGCSSEEQSPEDEHVFEDADGDGYPEVQIAEKANESADDGSGTGDGRSSFMERSVQEESHPLTVGFPRLRAGAFHVHPDTRSFSSAPRPSVFRPHRDLCIQESSASPGPDLPQAIPPCNIMKGLYIHDDLDAVPFVEGVWLYTEEGLLQLPVPPPESSEILGFSLDLPNSTEEKEALKEESASLRFHLLEANAEKRAAELQVEALQQKLQDLRVLEAELERAKGEVFYLETLLWEAEVHQEQAEDRLKEAANKRSQEALDVSSGAGRNAPPPPNFLRLPPTAPQMCSNGVDDPPPRSTPHLDTSDAPRVQGSC
ncbi:unnamed protein product [Darwinula stevensoni]|uniref:Uncharacterized protein n=1 Tax=Darwinula stevensoni TaxID=69355 RepID=A0A7R8X055_9CRUS|nr:unnamed protein product [Darwinula stevensoni]CAG0880752.1 unnamed protein product [Darwinula stevensoni]